MSQTSVYLCGVCGGMLDEHDDCAQCEQKRLDKVRANQPKQAAGNERYYLGEDELTIFDREVFCHGDGPIFQDDSLCRFENKGRAKQVLDILNNRPAEPELVADLKSRVREFEEAEDPPGSYETDLINLFNSCLAALDGVGEKGIVISKELGVDIWAMLYGEDKEAADKIKMCLQFCNDSKNELQQALTQGDNNERN